MEVSVEMACSAKMRVEFSDIDGIGSGLLLILATPMPLTAYDCDIMHVF